MRRAVTVAVAVVLLAAGCGSSDPSSPGRSAAGDTVKVGSLYPLSGAQGVGGTEEARGVELAAEWANAHGGVRGSDIELVEEDVERAEAVPSAMKRLAAAGATVVVGSHGSAISATAAKAAGTLDVVFWETGAVGELVPGTRGGRNFFRMAPMGANLGRNAITFVRDQMGSRLPRRPVRYAVANVDDAYGRSVADGAEQEVRRTPGLELVGRFEYDARDPGFAQRTATAIAASEPDVLFVSAYLDDGVALRRATVAARVPLLASIGTSSSYCHPAFGRQLGPDAVGLFASDKPDADEVNPEGLSPQGREALAWARATYERRHREPMSSHALSGFSNAFALFVHVLPTARSGDPDDVATAALSVKLPEGTLANGGGLDLLPPSSIDAGANQASAGVIWEWVRSGERAVVWPPAFATEPIRVLPLT